MSGSMVTRLATAPQGAHPHFENCAAPEIHNVLIDPELQSDIECWPVLPATLKVGILAMVESCTEK